MKHLFLIIFCIGLFFSTFNYAHASLTGDIQVPENKSLLGLASFYNKITNKFKDEANKITAKIEKNLVTTLGTFALFSIIFIVFRGWIDGESVSSNLIKKLGLLVALTSLIRTDTYQSIIVENLCLLFDNLPTIFSGQEGGNIISNLMKQTGDMADNLYVQVKSIGWGVNILAYISLFFAYLGILSILFVVILNVFEASVFFYLIIGMGGMFLLLAFFKVTRNYSVGAFNLVVGAILNVTILSFFLYIFEAVMEGLLVYQDMLDFVNNCIAVTLVSFLGTYFMTKVKSITQGITGQGIGTTSHAFNPINMAFPLTKQLYNMMKK